MLDLVRGTAAPRLIKAGDRHLLVSPPSLRGAATLVAHLAGIPSFREAHRERTGQDPPGDWSPRLGGRRAISTLLRDGFPLLLYVATRRDHPDLDYDRIAELAGSIYREDDIHLVAALATLGRPFRAGVGGDGDEKEDDAGAEGEAPDPGDRDGIESIDFGAMTEHPRVRFRLFTPAQVADMTLDQVANVMGGGQDDGPAQGKPMNPAEALAYARECMKARAEGREAPPCP
jgi:hypothetical protein